MQYKIFSDGATSKNGQEGAVGGWAFLIYDEDGNWILRGTGAERNTTNNRMEMTAIIEGLAAIQDFVDDFTTITIYSDSAYCINCVAQCWYVNWQNNGWRNSKDEPVKNQDLWEKLVPYFEDSRFFFKKVKGHSNVTENEEVDRLAKKAIADLRERERWFENNCN